MTGMMHFQCCGAGATECNWVDIRWGQCDGGMRHLQANMLLLLLLCFLLSTVSFSSLAVCCVTSASSSLGSGLGVSGSGVWKLK